jgi:uncharacterized membrane-anchored protein YitT (DUF2179 family)
LNFENESARTPPFRGKSPIIQIGLKPFLKSIYNTIRVVNQRRFCEMNKNTFLTRFLPDLRDFFLIFIGSLALSFSVVGFMAPNKILDGGFTGIAIILHHLWGTPIGAVALGMISITLVSSYFIMGPSFGKKTIIATLLFTLTIDLWGSVLNIGAITNDMTLAVFYGGLISGVSLGMIFYAGASTGGTDALATVIKKYTGLPLGRALLMMDMVVAFSAGLFFGSEALMYSLILIFIETQVIDLVLNGISATKRFWIISSHTDEIMEYILNNLGRGATIFKGEGAFTGENKKVIITYVPRRFVTQFKRKLHAIDPNVFVAIDPSSGVYGEGFMHPIND